MLFIKVRTGCQLNEAEAGSLSSFRLHAACEAVSVLQSWRARRILATNLSKAHHVSPAVFFEETQME